MILHQPLAVTSRYWPSVPVVLLLLRLRAIITPSTPAHTSARPANATTYGLIPSGRIPVSVEDAPVVGTDATGCDTTELPLGGEVDCPVVSVD